MKLDCKMEASGINEIVLFCTLQFIARYVITGGRYWEKFVLGAYGDVRATNVFLSDEQMMKKVKDLAVRKDTHVWVSYTTLNITKRE